MSNERLNYKLSNILRASTPERIDYKHFASKYTYGTGDGPVGNWTKAELKILLDEINRCYERLDKVKAMLKDNGLWVSQEGWEESDKDDELIVSMDYLIQALREASE